MKAASKLLASQRLRLRQLGALAALVLFVTLQVFASSARLHKIIHADADSASHQCVITLLAHGQVDVPSLAGVQLAFVAALFFLPPVLVACRDSSFDCRLSPSRAPPA